MIKNLFLMLLLLRVMPAFAQQPAQAHELVAKGMELHDKGQYKNALRLYDQALQLDKNNLAALTEKAFTLSAQRQWNKALQLSELAMKAHPGHPDLVMAHITRGTALEYLGRPTEAIRAFDQGLGFFPTAFLLYHHKGVTLANQGLKEEALQQFEKAVVLEPEDAGSHFFIGQIALERQQRIPALLALARFLELEPEGKRSKKALQQVRQLMSRPLPPGDESLIAGADFRAAETALALTAPLSPPQRASPANEAEQFASRFATLCVHLQGSGSGFFWTYYAPYFAEMEEVRLVLPFSYIIHASANQKYVNEWLKKHEQELARFYAWSEIYPWGFSGR